MTNRNYAEELGTPFIEDFSENGHRVRRNLLIWSSAGLVYLLFDLSIETTSSFSGLSIKGLSNEELLLLLFCLIFYHLIHFFLISSEHLTRHWLRLTGTWKAFDLKQAATSGGANFSGRTTTHEAPNDFTQSTLMTWAEAWPQIVELNEALSVRREQALINRIDNQTINKIRDLVECLEPEFSALNHRVTRFGCVWELYFRGNSLRWILWEFGLPVALALLNAALMFSDLFTTPH